MLDAVVDSASGEAACSAWGITSVPPEKPVSASVVVLGRRPSNAPQSKVRASAPACRPVTRLSFVLPYAQSGYVQVLPRAQYRRPCGAAARRTPAATLFCRGASHLSHRTRLHRL